MKAILVLALLVISTYADDELSKKLCGYSIESKQKIWDCVKSEYPALVTWEYCMQYLGTNSGGEFLNNRCGPSDVPLEQQESFSRCIEENINDNTIEQKSEEEEKILLRNCMQNIDLYL
ncbi:uncharacterized protein [Centruroides vittatus]|uniref:uncharacterized protein n=1 Tax=Centruroides vittatus TaxID=120091 RepID=UPI00350EE67E